jgi:hypothetical protein
MNISWDELLKRLRADRNYQSAFSVTYAGGAQRSSVLDALATFQRSLLTPDAPFDDYLRGAPDAITADSSAAISSSSPMAASPVIKAETWEATCSKNLASSPIRSLAGQ